MLRLAWTAWTQALPESPPNPLYFSPLELVEAASPFRKPPASLSLLRRQSNQAPRLLSLSQPQDPQTLLVKRLKSRLSCRRSISALLHLQRLHLTLFSRLVTKL